MNESEFRLRLEIDNAVLDVWIEQGWLIPETTGEGRHFREADLARGQLILDLINAMGVNEPGVDLVMDLVDQLHALRGTLRDLTDAVCHQDADVQEHVLSELYRLERQRRR
ncbi:chaperone modulator CbpM [Rhizobium sp. LEGMi198b]|uniref:chaperone modulator CbpM n=1 Tax=unclassified Rhizobium TaxID=2613769 RepID=UPI000CDF52FE|nr:MULTISPECIES: chaperone modulator CbpM [Rhizobium]AVA20801.1 transcriptional regulator protein [Rhizobium sp. NXC24]MDK4738945.1 chaperone modulator CbpM [Rhizobium sp. CNPSo 3464]UWU22013.1 chaperone modulator CbpM [Rhizobium tropici]